MRTPSNIAVEMEAAVTDRQAAWQFIRRFAAIWASPITQGDGFTHAELDAAEERLGQPLPAALREAYALFGRRRDLTSNQDTLLEPHELHLDQDANALIFRVENQAAVRWAVLLGEADQPDPPVVFRLDLADKQAESWDAWLGTFSTACLEIVLSESLYAPEELCDNREQEFDDAALLESQYTRLSLPNYPTSQVNVAAIGWFAGPDVVLRDDQHTWLWARARTPAALELARRSLPGQWVNAD